MRYLETLDSTLPRAWKRPPSFMNTLRAFRQSEYRRVKVRQQKYLAARRAARRAPPQRKSNLRPLLARLNATRRAMMALVALRGADEVSPVLSKLQMYEKRLAQQIKADVSSNSGRRPQTAVSGTVTRTTFKQVQVGSSALERAAAATHARSTRHMFTAERALSA